MIIDTKRLRLRPWLISDAPSLYEYAKNPLIGPVAGWPVHTSIANSQEIIASILSEPETYAICLKQDNSPIGCIGLLFGEKSNVKDITVDEAEVGYWIAEPFWGKGLTPEALNAVMQYAFETLQLEKLWCGNFSGNEQSRSVQKKCGFIYSHTNKDVYWSLLDEFRTEHVSFLTKKRWQKLQAI